MKKDTEKKKYLNFLTAFLIEILVTAIFIFVFALIMFLTETGFEYSAVFATISVAIGCFFGGLYAASKNGEKGFITGAIIGGMTFLAVTIISLIADQGAITVNTLFHFIIMMLSAIIGGIIGVNKGQKKKYI